MSRIRPDFRTVGRVLVVVCVVGTAAYQAHVLGAGQAGVKHLALAPVMELKLHGSSPSMAWSPDSGRVAVNSAYCVHSPAYGTAKRYASKLGLYVLDPGAGRVDKVATQQAFHPFWLNDETLGFGNSYYEEGPDGLYLVGIHQGAKVKRIGKLDAVHRTHLGRDGRILMYASAQKHGWHHVDPETGKAVSAIESEHDAPHALNDPWNTPIEWIQDQCPRRVGPVAVEADRQGIRLKYGREEYFLSNQRPFLYDFKWAPDRGKGPVQPCLSPDGRHLAYLTPAGDEVGYTIKVVRVPGAGEARVAARDAPVKPAPAGVAGPGARLEAKHRLTLHGSTPSMAWSPDSRRLAVNAAYEYYGYDAQLKRYRKMLGIYLVDARSGKAVQVTNKQGYHPFWFNRSTVGWGHSEYEDGKSGVYMAKARKRARVRRIGKLKGVHRTLLLDSGLILAYVGWPDSLGWVSIDPETGKHHRADAFGGVSSWETPGKGVRDQCPQAVGQTSVQPDEQHGYFLLAGGTAYALGDGKLFRFRQDYGSGAKRAVRPCLSPDGKHLAFLRQADGGGGYELNVARVPR